MVLLFCFVCLCSGLTLNPRPSGFNVYSFLYQQEVNKKATMTDVKFKEMTKDVQTFYSSSDSLFWRDWSGNDAMRSFGSRDETQVWVAGNLVLNAFQTFNDIRGVLVYESVSDTSLVADYQFDVLRMATQFQLLDETTSATRIQKFATAYKRTVESYVGGGEAGPLRIFDISSTEGVLKAFLLETLSSFDRSSFLAKWTELDEKKTRIFQSSDYLGKISEEVKADILRYFKRYIYSLDSSLKSPENSGYFKIKDMAQRSKDGVGQIGKQNYWILIEGPTEQQDDDVILDVLQGWRPSGFEFDQDSSERYLAWFPCFLNEGQRREIGYRARSVESFDLLGNMPLTLDGELYPFFVKEVSPYTNRWDMTGKNESDVLQMAENWGTIIATQHSRSDKLFDDGDYLDFLFPEAFKNATSEGDFVAFVKEFAQTYAKQVKVDFAEFVAEFDENKGAPLPSKAGLTKGQIIGIVIGVVLGFVVIVGIAVFLAKKYPVQRLGYQKVRGTPIEDEL